MLMADLLFEFSSCRYEDVHRAAIRWPSKAFQYIGIDNESQKGEDYDGERKGGLEPFVKDTYGCSGVLQAKRSTLLELSPVPKY